eukprot:5941141-Alexandrium_andersonii.AAC.1
MSYAHCNGCSVSTNSTTNYARKKSRGSSAIIQKSTSRRSAKARSRSATELYRSCAPGRKLESRTEANFHDGPDIGGTHCRLLWAPYAGDA